MTLGRCTEEYRRYYIWNLTRGPNRHISRRSQTVLIPLNSGPAPSGYVEVALTSSAQPLGGERLWFCCPACQGRVGCLYSPQADPVLMCRTCWGFRYPSELRHRNRDYENIERPQRWLAKIETRLFGSWEAPFFRLLGGGRPKTPRPVRKYLHATRRARLLTAHQKWTEALAQGETQLCKRELAMARAALERYRRRAARLQRGAAHRV
jgi:hypothetical protein